MKRYVKHAKNLLLGEKNGKKIGAMFFIAVKGVGRII
tara:strand:+ start:917 stop:1027 length:111 start_codon:yes stop_codon:yes gene_type:complete